MSRFRLVSPAAAVAVLLALGACGGSGDSDASRRAALDALSTPTGPMTVVPHLLGRRQRDAIPLARRAGLTVKPSFQGSLANPAVDSGCVQVVSQAPPAGTRRPRGSQIGVDYGVCHAAIGAARARSARHHLGISASLTPPRRQRTLGSTSRP